MSLKTEVEAVLDDITGAARTRIEDALAKAKADEAALKPVADTFEQELEAALQAAEPGVKTAVTAAAGKLLIAVRGVIASGAL